MFIMGGRVVSKEEAVEGRECLWSEVSEGVGFFCCVVFLKGGGGDWTD